MKIHYKWMKTNNFKEESTLYMVIWLQKIDIHFCRMIELIVSQYCYFTLQCIMQCIYLKKAAFISGNSSDMIHFIKNFHFGFIINITHKPHELKIVSVGSSANLLW